MPYPPPVPPTTRTNATPMVDNHPSDHLVISAALTEIINHIAALETKYDAQTPQVYGGLATGGLTPAGEQRTIATMTLGNAGWYLLSYTVALVSTAVISGSLRFFVNSGYIFQYFMPAATVPASVSISLIVNAPTPGSTIQINMINEGTAGVDSYPDGTNHRLGAVRVVYP